MPKSMASELEDDDDLDEMMDNMGLAKTDMDDVFGGPKKARPPTAAPQRDTLGFLDRA